VGIAREQRGQASVELVAAVPVLLLAALAAAQLALVGWALWSAGAAARAGARAELVGGDSRAAAIRALPGFLREGADVRAAGAVGVRLSVPALLPGAPALPVSASAGLDPRGGEP
jgi:hypothetical protein